MTARDLVRRSGPPPQGGDALLVVALAAGAAGAGFWVASGVAVWLTAGHWPSLPLSHLAAAIGRLPRHLANPVSAWQGGGGAASAAASVTAASPAGAASPAAVAAPPAAAPASAAVFYLCLLGLAVLAALGVRRGGPGRRRQAGARWARPADLRTLAAGKRRRGARLVLGRTAGRVGRRRLVATEARHSVLVIGPTQSGKTTGLAIPAVLEWPGPVVATSVKDDLATATMAWRNSRGPCWVFDPTCSAGPGVTDTGRDVTRARWSPLSACATFAAAQKTASWLVESTPGRRGMSDAAFWYATAGKQLAPLLLAAHRGGLTMADVVRWTDSQDYDEPLRYLQIAGDDDASVALAACAGRDERIRSSVSTTLETVLAPFEDPVVASSTAATDLSLDDLLRGNGTLYLCGPSHEQNRVQGLFAALVSAVTSAVVAMTAATGRPLDPPLLLVLDEAANIAPVRDLDTLASTGAGLGIQLVTVCQDLAQLSARYDAERARTITNNHRAKLLLSGVGDLQTLDLISGLAGEHVVREQTTTQDLKHGGRTRSEAATLRRLAPTDQLRTVRPGEAVLIYGHLPPVRLQLRPWYRDRSLRRMAGGPGTV